MIISLHIPKTAGTSFKYTLKEHFGDGLLEDYGTRPMQIPYERGRKKAQRFNGRLTMRKYRNVQCIHGHFLAMKYASFLPTATFITWFRDPLDRLFSNYYHILRTDPGARNTIPYKVHREGWTLEEYCFNPLLKNYCSNFFWNFDLEAFEFIGIVENYESEMEYFANRYLGSDFNIFRANVNPERTIYEIDPAMRQDLLKFHSKDMAIYQRALERSMSRR